MRDGTREESIMLPPLSWREGVLFSPCSGSDIDLPFELFLDVVSEFWFVDVNYSCDTIQSLHPDLTCPSGYRVLRADTIHPSGIQTDDDRVYADHPPCLRTTVYEHEQTGRRVVVNTFRRRGPSALLDLPVIHVFFYRGDSLGEGGSGTWWLTQYEKKRRMTPLIQEVLARLPGDGLIVTDGSNCREDEWNPYRHFSLVQRRGTAKEIIRSGFSFFDDNGNLFECVGYVGNRYGPTFVWKLRNRGKE